jgi:hypothetical protein
LDLRDTHIDSEASVDAFALFGSVAIPVPMGWRVTLNGLPIFGAFEDRTAGTGPMPCRSAWSLWERVSGRDSAAGLELVTDCDLGSSSFH